MLLLAGNLRPSNAAVADPQPGRCRREERKKQGLKLSPCLVMNFENLRLETEWEKGYNVLNKRADD